MRAVVIVQARMNSKRFPGKVLADLCGYPMLWWVLTRAMEIEGADHLTLAVPDEADSDQLEQIAYNLGIKVWRGSETDVLGRYLGAARKAHADYIVRITADCPLIDPVVCDAVLTACMVPGVDYASNCLPRTFEKGLDCEAFTRWSLELAASKAETPYDREHVTPWMQKSRLLHKVNVESGAPARANDNLSVDTPEDLEVVRAVLEARLEEI